MVKYLIKRILLSIASLLIVMSTVMILIYTLMNRESIFSNDPNLNKKQGTVAIAYKYNKWQEYGYLEYHDCWYYLNPILDEEFGPKESDGQPVNTERASAVNSISSALNDKKNWLNNKYLKAFNDYFTEQKWDVKYFEAELGTAPYLIAVYEKNSIERIRDFLKSLITIETKHDVPDTEEIERYIRWEWDELSNMPALVGSGTTHKYLIYFDDIFPYVHQNLVHVDIGTSQAGVNKGRKIISTMLSGIGNPVNRVQQSPVQIAEGKGETSENPYNYHTVTYSKVVTDFDMQYFTDNYINPSNYLEHKSRMYNSFIIGIISLVLAYALGLPLGILMSRRKDKLFDKIGNAYIIFIMAVPSLAYIFIFAGIGTNLFGLPYKFQNAEIRWLAYILPTISLALPSIGSLMKWVRRYMIDQMNSDYVKFARSQGLSESEIFNKHIFPNAMIYLIQGIPGNILGCLTGAIITERVYGVEGIGNLLTNAITQFDNGTIVGCTFFYTFLSLLSLLLGDLLLAKYDPRISFTEGGN